jgi:hypothetical protein
LNSRVRPTPNAPPHAGHAWVIWKNYEAARATGGTFTVVFDDVIYGAAVLDLSSPGIARMREEWLCQVEWLCGEPPDVVAMSTDFSSEHAAACEKLGLRMPRQFKPQSFVGDPVFQATIATTPALEHALHPAFCVTRVVDDALLHVEGFIRGKDLLRECALYDYFACALGYPGVRQSYVHTVTRMRHAVGLKESSSTGAPTLAQLRAAGYKPQEIIDTLEECNRRSRIAGQEQNVLPVGVLEPDHVRVLESRVASEIYRQAMGDAAGKPYQQDVENAVKAREKGSQL